MTPRARCPSTDRHSATSSRRQRAVGAVHRQRTLSAPRRAHSRARSPRLRAVCRDPNPRRVRPTMRPSRRATARHTGRRGQPDGVVGELLHLEVVAAVHDLAWSARTRVDQSRQPDGTRRRYRRLGPPAVHDRGRDVIRRTTSHSSRTTRTSSVDAPAVAPTVVPQARPWTP